MTRGQLAASRIALWNQQNPHAVVDADAALRVAAQEGLGGGRGDNNSSFGPWQLHAGGALPKQVWEKGADYAHDWAWSPEGLDYAIRHIADVSAGLKGQQAVANIVRRFERPANPDREIARALGSPVGSGGAAPTSTPVTQAQVTQPQAQSPSPDLTALLALLPAQESSYRPLKLRSLQPLETPVGQRALVNGLDLLQGLR